MSLIWRYKSLHLSSFKGHYLQFKPLLIKYGYMHLLVNRPFVKIQYRTGELSHWHKRLGWLLRIRSNQWPSISCPRYIQIRFLIFYLIFNLFSVSCATPASALTTVDVKIFRHEFITVFRFSESKTFHPADICIVEPIDDRWTRYEEENETVFLARDLVARLRMMANPPPMGLSRRKQMQRSRLR